MRLQAALLVVLCCAVATEEHVPEPRIYNGDDADIGEFPFISLLLASTGFDEEDGPSQNMCGSSILTERVLLTAAHCVVRDILEDSDSNAIDEIYHPRNLEIYAGRTQGGESTEQHGQIAGIIVHEDYDGVTVENDIALVILSESLTLDAAVATIALPDDADVSELYAAGAAVTVIGWGTTETGEVTDDLQKLPYNITSTSDCAAEYGDSLLDGMMCTGVVPMEQHSGAGDSGGPLFTKKNDSWVQLALTSWGPSEMSNTTYDVNANVSYYKSWITTNRDIALTDYISSMTATDSVQEATFSGLRNYLYKTIHVAPANSSKYTNITIKSGTMKDFDYLMIYDGSSVLTDKMLAQLSGSLSEQTFTASTTNGLTVAMMTSKSNESDGFVMEYSQVDTAGSSETLICPSGYTACSDRLYCVHDDLLCNDNGDCQDFSDEAECTDNETEEEEDEDDGVECYSCETVLNVTVSGNPLNLTEHDYIQTTCSSQNETVCTGADKCMSYMILITDNTTDTAIYSEIHGCFPEDTENNWTPETYCKELYNGSVYDDINENATMSCWDLEICEEDCRAKINDRNSAGWATASIVYLASILFVGDLIKPLH